MTEPTKAELQEKLDAAERELAKLHRRAERAGGDAHEVARLREELRASREAHENDRTMLDVLRKRAKRAEHHASSTDPEEPRDVMSGAIVLSEATRAPLAPRTAPRPGSTEPYFPHPADVEPGVVFLREWQARGPTTRKLEVLFRLPDEEPLLISRDVSMGTSWQAANPHALALAMGWAPADAVTRCPRCSSQIASSRMLPDGTAERTCGNCGHSFTRGLDV